LFVRSIALQCGMLMRRRAPNAREECWHIHYGDVRVGTIAKRVGNPFDTDPWEWTCGFYPGSHTGECTSETSETFDQARGEFEAAWAVFLSKRTEADNGAIGGIGRLRNIAASIEASACCRTGSRRGLMKSLQGWKRPFDDPIPLLRGRSRISPAATAEANRAGPRRDGFRQFDVDFDPFRQRGARRRYQRCERAGAHVREYP
jgi:hypothetical protein